VLSWLLVVLTVDPGAAVRAQSPEALRKNVNGLLRDELTKRWYPRALDQDSGGFHQNFARDWSSLPDRDRFLVYQARMIWTAAAFAEYSPEHREEYTKYVLRGVRYLDEVMRDRDHGGFHWMVDPQGHVNERLGTEKHVYGLAFVIYAASKAHSVTKDPLALTLARDAFDWVEKHAHDAKCGGYFEALTRDGTPILAWKPDDPVWKRVDRVGVYYGFKTMNVHIHMLEALAELSRVDSRPLVRERLEETFKIVRDKIAVEPGALNLYSTRDWRATPAHDSFGHDVETAYLLVEAAEALGMPDDPKTWHVARSLVDHALDWGWDENNGGFYDKGEAFGGEAFAKNKIWWTEAEGLNALLVMHRKFGKSTDRYWKAFLKQWEFIEKHLLDPQYGGWYAETTADGQLVGDGQKANPWKANYHTSRAMMNVARMLGEMADRR
jgi:mannobiose 2-epimerase